MQNAAAALYLLVYLQPAAVHVAAITAAARMLLVPMPLPWGSCDQDSSRKPSPRVNNNKDTKVLSVNYDLNYVFN